MQTHRLMYRYVPQEITSSDPTDLQEPLGIKENQKIKTMYPNLHPDADSNEVPELGLALKSLFAV